jgi:hypothetical protein
MNLCDGRSYDCQRKEFSNSGKFMNVFDLSQPVADTLFKWSNAFIIIGAVFALVGAFGAIWTGGIRERYGDERISRNEADTALARKTAATANEGAATANANAATANENAAKANERTELLRQSNLEVQRELERERMERLRLEESVAPRRLSDEQRSSLITALRSAPQPLTVQVTLLGDQEAGTYGKAILEALNAANVQGSAGRAGIMTPPPYGIKLTLQQGNPKSVAIKAAFEQAHIPITSSFADTGAFDARILIGLRPLGPAK